MKLKKLSHLLLPLLILIFTPQAMAEKGSRMVAVADKDSIILKWPLLNEVPWKDITVEIWRKSGISAFRKIATLKPIADPSHYRGKYPDPLVSLINAVLYGKYPQEKKDRDFFEAFFYLKLLVYPDLAEDLALTYRDKQVKRDRYYSYKLKYIYQGESIKEYKVDKISLKDYKELPKFRVKLTPLDKKIGLKWDLVSPYLIYIVYRDNELLTPGGVFIQDKDVKFYFVDEGLENGKTYTYKILGIDPLGRQSPPVIVKGSPKDLTPPPIPINLKGELKNGKVYLSWDASSADDLKGYNVYRSESIKGKFIKLNTKPLKERKFVDRQVEMGKNYWYAVTAVDKNGNESPFSQLKLVQYFDTIPPAPPKGLKAEAEAGKVILSWEPNSEEDLLGYYVLRGLKRSDNMIILGGGEVINENRYVDEDLRKEMDNVDIFYAVKAVDKSYNQSQPSEVIKVRLPDVTPPQAPEVINCLPSASSIKVKFQLLDPDVVETVLQLYNKGGKLLKEAETKGTEYEFKGLKPEEQYLIKLYTVDDAGNKSEVRQVEVRTTYEKPERINVDLKVKKEENHYLISWKIVSTTSGSRS